MLTRSVTKLNEITNEEKDKEEVKNESFNAIFRIPSIASIDTGNGTKK